MTPSSPHHSARSFPAALTSPCVRQKNIKTLAGHRLIPPNQMKTMVDSRKNRVFTSKNWELILINGDSSGWFHQTKKRDNFTPSIDVKIGIWPMKNGSWAVGIIFPRAWPHDGYDGKLEAFHGSKSKFPYQNGHEWGINTSCSNTTISNSYITRWSCPFTDVVRCFIHDSLVITCYNMVQPTHHSWTTSLAIKKRWLADHRIPPTRRTPKLPMSRMFTH